MRIEVSNAFSRIWVDHPVELKLIDEATSYPVEGAQFSAAYRNHVWDGREHLIRKSRGGDYYVVPTGVLVDLDEDLMRGVELIDKRRSPGERMELEWAGPPLRDYQTRAIEAATKDQGVFTGRGMWNLPIRSGKTKTAAGLIQRLGLRTLFIVPSDMLLWQTAEAFREDIADCPVGTLGDGSREVDWITVATAQTLLARPKLARKLLAESDVLLMDEAHRLEGEAWRKMVIQSDAPYKIGLSATIFVSRLKENNAASIWLKACTGPIIDRVSMNYLFQRGYLIRPDVLFYPFHHTSTDRRGKDWQWVARELLAQNPQRNRLIVDVAAAAVNKGYRVLIDAGRHDHMSMLMTMARSNGLSVARLDGNSSREARRQTMRQLKTREISLVIGNILGEGVDIPELEVVINAEGQKKATAAIQRMRNLTPSKDTGKDRAYFIDIADIGNPILQKHSLERLKLYKGMRGFRVRVCERDGKSDPFAG